MKIRRNIRFKGAVGRYTTVVLFCVGISCLGSPQLGEYAIADGTLLTKWTDEVTPENVHQEYPRPQMVREKWQNLNGLWDYSVVPRDESKPTAWQGKILIPFPIESALSGVGMSVSAEENLWYHREFSMSENWRGKRWLLHFGAIDFESTVWVNGIEVGSHRGGYDAFSIDVSDALIMGKAQSIVIKVWDPTDNGPQPRGKQVNNPGGIWYTAVTGIWQTVWLEPVPETFIQNLTITPDLDNSSVDISAHVISEHMDYSLEVKAKGNWWTVAKGFGKDVKLKINNPKLWTPETPHLYDLDIRLKDAHGEYVDRVQSYFGMRKIHLAKDDRGFNMFMLNNEPVFQVGPLDQGWWPDGLYTAPTDEALRYDIEVTKKLGFNMARKHVKVEPDRWYYWCDKLGLLIWQDMPSGDAYIGGDDPDVERSKESGQQFKLELRNMIQSLYNHPSIVLWVPYNEGWGQWATREIVEYIEQLDPTRLIINASGWADRGVGDAHDIHAYPGPAMPDLEEERAAVLGEFGGLGLAIKGHLWQDGRNWGYRNLDAVNELTADYEKLFMKLEKYKTQGLAAAVYTQTTDVESEINGLMTYDRAVIKMNPNDVARMNQGYLSPVILTSTKLFLNGQNATVSIETSRDSEIRYTLDGSEPDLNSSRYSGPLSIDHSATIKARNFWVDGSFSGASEQRVERVDLEPAVDVTDPKPDLQFNYYEWEVIEGKIPTLAEIEASIPHSTGTTGVCNLATRLRDDFIAYSFTGYIHIQEAEVYTFYSESDDGSLLYIDDHLVVDHNGFHAMTEKSGQIALSKGYHKFKLLYFQGEGGKGLNLRYEGADIEKQIIPPTVFAH
ncbi:MAG: hypothetical protein HOB84_10415 [Candidatus Marinimicrobia bacterium]|jgi:hypothetical protein|nr:hypothetical protein [Candidatus Neomarinimicrobiota bacterium]MBT4361241.1 hypothetical protein [Candidatus Neomarinimicrobiota bacterium]MBT4715174.1 hypothetical protein [Candidatus Neomarinimicrobiota bacterium]MBT4947348.1 hypothetical protein [Candidatus Neomarinimicrobiota bacterium]MBT5271463.1 hypothetical protein [Candidatus Neomarinimicrobiota bacterium]